MTAFVLWLAAGRLPLRRCSDIQRRVQHFVDWSDIEFAGRSVPVQYAVWCYLEHLRRRGAADSELRTAWATLDLWLNHAGCNPLDDVRALDSPDDVGALDTRGMLDAHPVPAPRVPH